MSYQELAKFIVENVGGSGNVKALTHCVTRLRFILKDESKVNTNALKNKEGIMTVVQKGGQYQVVIGNHVSEVYEAVMKIGNFQGPSNNDNNDKKDEKKIDKLISTIAGIFTPILALLCACGVIKGTVIFIGALGWIDSQSGTFIIINSIGDTIFYFFPVFIGYTAAEKFGMNKFVGLAIGASLIHPSISALGGLDTLYTLFSGTFIETNVTTTFAGIPVLLMKYSSTVLPTILAVYFGSYVEKAMKKIIPTVLKNFMVPALTLVVTVVSTLLIVGPIATWVSDGIGALFLMVYELSPILTGALIGGVFQLLVMFGLHQGLQPIRLNNIMTNGYDNIVCNMQAVPFATCAVVFAVYLKTKNKKLKQTALPAAISSFFGVSEPSIYGVTLPLKKPFIITLIASAIGGAIMGFFNSKLYTVAGLGLFAFPAYINPETGFDMSFYGVLIAVGVAMIFGFVVTYITHQDVEEEQGEDLTIEEKIKQEGFISPVAGEVIELNQVNDEVFSSGLTGKGIGIIPTEGKVYAPADGEVSLLFDSGHAVGLTTKSGAELLIHVGIDTVQLEGKGFTKHVNKGDKVKKGQLLLSFDQESIKNAGYDDTVVFVVTNTDSFLDVLTDEQADQDVIAVVV